MSWPPDHFEWHLYNRCWQDLRTGKFYDEDHFFREEAMPKFFKRLKFHCDQDWMKGTHVKGVVLGRHVFFAMPAQDVPRWLFRHELEHCYQIEREGAFKFYFKYLWYSLRYGYERNPYERDAHDMQSLPLSPSEEALLCKLREG